MPFFRIRLTPQEFTVALVERLRRVAPATSPGMIGPLRIALWRGDAGPYIVNPTPAFQSYQLHETDLDDILDETARAVAARLHTADEDASWEEARQSVRPWLLSPDDPAIAACPSGGAIGPLTITYVYDRPLRDALAFAKPAQWGITPDVLHRQAMTNLRSLGARVVFHPVSGAPGIWRLHPRDRFLTSRLLLPEVQRAISNRTGSDAGVFLAARDAVFVGPLTVWGDAPAAFAALDGTDSLCATPLLIRDGHFALQR